MTFLAMSSWQAWLVLGLSATAIVVIFFLRIQHRLVRVSSSLLWQRVLERRRRRSWLELLRRVLSLLLALAIGLSLVLSFTEAEIGSGDAPRRVAVVIDTTVSMGARTRDGHTRLDRARRLADQLLSGGSGADTFVVYDGQGRAVAPASRDRAAARAAIAALVPLARSLQIPEIQDTTEVWLISDGVSVQQVPPGVKLLDVYEPADNVAVTAFEMHAVPTDSRRYEAFLEVGNFSEGPHQLTVQLRDERQVQFRRSLTLEPGGLYRTSFDLSPLPGGVLQASVSSDGDALALDDRGFVVVPTQDPVDVLLVAQPADPIEQALVAIPHVRVATLDPARYEEWVRSAQGGGIGGMASPMATDPVPVDGIVFVGYAPAQAPVLPSLLVAPPPVDWLPRRMGSVDVSGQLPTAVGGPSMLRFVDLHDLGLTRLERYATDRARVLARAAEVPVLLEGMARNRWLLLPFALGESYFAQGLSFPIFLENLMDWFSPVAPMLRRFPGTVALPWTGVSVTRGTGEQVPVRSLGDRTVFQARSPGVYRVAVDARVVPVAVSVNSRALAAINRRNPNLEVTALRELPAGHLLWPILLPLVAALLLLEALTYHRRVTV